MSTRPSKKDTPRNQLNRTDDLIGIFSGTGRRGNHVVYRSDQQNEYEQVYKYWSSYHNSELSTVVGSLRAYRNVIEPKLAAEQQARNTTALQKAIESLATAARDAAGVSTSRIDGHLPKIRVYQSEPPVGRDDDRDQCIIALRAATTRGIVLFGAPGQGKTALARYIATSIASDYAGVHEVDLESERQIENLPRLIASTLGYPEIPSSYEALQRVLQAEPSLILLDAFDLLLNTGDQSKLLESLRRLGDALSIGSRVIITCQRRFERDGFITREVRPLSGEHALTLFHRFSENVYADETKDEVRTFVTGDLAAHPLSIKIVGRYGGDLRLPFDDLKRLWKKKWEEIADQSPSLDDRGLLTAFELTYHSLSPSEQSLFLTLALLPDGISPELIKAVWPEREPTIYGVLRTLRHRSLLEDPLPGSLGRLRGPLFQFALNRRQDTERDDDSNFAADLNTAAAQIDTYFDVYVTRNAPQDTDHDPGKKNDLLRSHFHNIHASLDRRLDPSTKPSTISAAQAVLHLYWAYHNNLSGANNPIASTDDATTYLKKASDVFLANGMREEEARCRFYIGTILWLRGNIPEAQVYLRDIELSTETDQKMRLDSKRSAAHIEYKQGVITSSVEKYEAVVREAKEADYELCALKCRVGLMDAYRKLGDFDSGVRVFHTLEETMGKYGGGLKGNALRGYAYLLAENGESEASKSKYEAALEEFRVHPFGQAHCYRGLGDVFVKLGRHSEAEVAFDTAMRLYDDALKNPSLGVGLVYLGRARLALAMTRHGEALQWCRRAAELFDPRNQNEPYELGVAHELLGDVHFGTMQREAARATYEIARAYFVRVGAERIARRVTDKITDIGH